MLLDFVLFLSSLSSLLKFNFENMIDLQEVAKKILLGDSTYPTSTLPNASILHNYTQCKNQEMTLVQTK